MIPVLYTAGKSEAEIRPIGALIETISCITTEERNGAYETTLEYPSSGALAEEIQPERIIYVKTNDTDEAQPMRIVTVTKEQDNTMTVYAQHVSYQLNGVVVMPFTASGIQDALFQISAYAPEFTFSSDNDSTAAFTVSVPTNLRSLLGGTDGSLLDVYGGEYHFDGWNVTFDKSRGLNRGALIAYGKNLTDLSAENDLSDAVTGVLPYYQDQDGNVTALDEPITLEHSLSYDRITALDCSSEIEVEEDASEGVIKEALQAYAESWLNSQSAEAADSITLSFESLYQAGEDGTKALEIIALCDTVTIWDKRYNLNLTAKCITAEYDGMQERYTSLEIGQTKSSFSSTLQSAIQEAVSEVASKVDSYPSRWEQAISEVAAKITGQTDSHIILYPMENPQMLIAAEDTDLSKPGVAALVICSGGIVTTEDIAAALATWNQGGDPFTGAMSIDGYLVERVVQAITIEGEQIIAGVIQNASGTVRINLDTGDAYVPRLIAVTDNGGECYGIEQGTFNLSGASYSGMRFFKTISVAPPFDSPEGDYFQILKATWGARLRAINDDENDMYIDLLGDSGTASGDGNIIQVRAGSTKSVILQLAEDGDLSIPGRINVGNSAPVGSSVGTTGGRIEEGGNFVSLGGGFYAQQSGTNMAYLLSSGLVYGQTVQSAGNVVAGNEVSGETVSGNTGDFTGNVTASQYIMGGDSHAGLRQFTDHSFGLTWPSTTNLQIALYANGGYSQKILFSGDGANAQNYLNWNWNGYLITNAQVTTSSDRRLKKYITDSKEQALPILDAVPVRQYTYKKDAPECLSGKKVRFGQIAQELEEVYPEAVVYDEQNDQYYIDKISLIDLLLKGVQELSAKVTALEEKLGKENANAI